MTTPRHAIVVLGMHRSGTSAMTRVLGLSGARLPEDPLPPAADNIEGFWESRAVTRLNDELLAARGSDWDDVFSGYLGETGFDDDLDFRLKGREVIKTAFGGGDLIAVKDPRINVLVPFWGRALRDEGYEPSYAVMVRHPLEVAASLRERNGFPVEKGLLLWLANMVGCERDTRGARRTFVTYTSLLSSWATCLDRVLSTAGVHLSRSAAAVELIDAFLKPAMRHQRVESGGLDELQQAWPDVAEAYAWFCAAARDEAADPGPMTSLQASLSAASARWNSVLADLRRELRVERQSSTQLRDDLTARPDANALDRLESDHRARVAEMLAEIEHLQTANDADRAAAAARHVEMAAALAHEREMRREDGKRAADELNAVAGRVQSAHQQNAALESRMSALELERADLLEANTSTIEALARLGAQVDSGDARRAELERQVTGANANLDAAGERLSALTEEKETLESKLKAHIEELAAGQAAYALLSDAHKALLASRSWRLTRGLRVASSWSSCLSRSVRGAS